MTPPIAGTVLVVLVVETTLDVVVLDVGVLEELDGAKATDGLGGGTTATEAVGEDAEEEDARVEEATSVEEIGDPYDMLNDAPDRNAPESPFCERSWLNRADKSLGEIVLVELNPVRVPLPKTGGRSKREPNGFEVVKGVPGTWNAGVWVVVALGVLVSVGVGVGGAMVMKSPRILVTSANPFAAPAVTSLKIEDAGVCTIR